MSKNEHIDELTVRELLSGKTTYLVPMYQRNYAWGEGQIKQLIQDVVDSKLRKVENYYIGTLVVYVRKDGRLEVIDGQQRFTTLSLILAYLKNSTKKPDVKSTAHDVDWFTKPNITFESRPKSQETFDDITCDVAIEQMKVASGEKYNDGLVTGYDLIGKELASLKEISLHEFSEYLLSNVKIMRVAVPSDTDLNHYFEIMNNRGEQLEKHEVLKAKLMSVLQDNLKGEKASKALHVLDTVWEACANMERYVQYGFSSSARKSIFGQKWDEFKAVDFAFLETAIDSDPQDETRLSVMDVIRGKKIPDMMNKKETQGAQQSDRFTSVINFSNFLLHVLRVHLKNEDVVLDDKQLINVFEEQLLGTKTEAPEIAVQKFTFALLKCKFLFDHYVIKRELSQSNDGWSLKKLKLYESDSASFVNSFAETDNSYNSVNRELLMLLSALHVSTPTLVYKHWLTAVLHYLYEQEKVIPDSYLNYLENISRRFIFQRFLCASGEKEYFDIIFNADFEDSLDEVALTDISHNKLKFGSIENNFVFNYLDYLIWKTEKNSGNKIFEQFEFTFRSSVEHFYPQHPMKGHEPLDEDYLHQFGNLCLISHNKNSRLSNMPPDTKLEDIKVTLSNNKIDSLKLHKMMQMTLSEGKWGKEQIQKHGEEMIELLLSSTDS
tara:strand:- start:9278 stop:11269 length:1992 start_codon:yes stop_codon:yes gene_type:complete